MDTSNLQMEPETDGESATLHARRDMFKWLIQVERATSEPEVPDDNDEITGTTIESLLN